VDKSKYFIWSEAQPTKEQIKLHINEFLTAISQFNFDHAFYLCPVYTYESKKLIADNSQAPYTANSVANMYDLIDGYGYLDDHKKNHKISFFDFQSWCHHITPPKLVDYENVNLDVHSESGEVLANVHIDYQVTDITSIFSLVKEDSVWVLCFKMFKVL
jgi:hypothetical protein